MSRTALLAALLLVACGKEGPPPRNLLILCVDTLRADELGAYGRAPSVTPALDALAAGSVVFERAHAAASWTLPSVGALFTSAYPSTTKLWSFDSRLDESFTTLAERFRAGGYATHGIASHVFFDGAYGLQQGFASFDDELCHRGGDEGWKPITSPDVSRKAIEWLQARASTPSAAPWLLFVHFFDPHWLYLDHEGTSLADESRSERERYRSEIAFTDRHVGALLAALEESGLAATTNVLFFSDHGESFQEHPGIQRHSYSLYEAELRVPLFLRVPGVAPRRVAPSVRTVDLLPTLLELHGLAPAEEPLEGVSLVPLLEGGALAPREHLAEIRLKTGYHTNALVRGRHKLIEQASVGRLSLYDLESDPEERVDLVAREPELVAELERALRAKVREAEARGERFGVGGVVETSPAELELLQKLGYGGDDGDDE
ncbi:MAG TPA: sulfatase [Planctomycetota bacterium]